MRVIVSGGAGFLGSHLSEALLVRGDSVECVDELSTGRLSNIEHLLHLPTFESDVSVGIPVRGAVQAVTQLASPAETDRELVAISAALGASPPELRRRPAPTLGPRRTEGA